MLKAPEPIASLDIRPYDTMIRLKLRNDDVIEKVKREMRDFEGETMLFLPKIDCIAFDDGASQRILRRISADGDLIKITDSAGSESSFILSSGEKRIANGRGTDESMRMAVAIPVGKPRTEARWPLYSFFPIKDVSCPFPAILHATFCLTDNRNNLDLSSDENRQVNKRVMDELLKFYVEQVCRHVSPGERLRMLTPSNFPIYYRDNGKFRFEDSLGQLGCEQGYRDLCKISESLCDVNGSGVSPIDSPLLFRDVPEAFKGNEFSGVVSCDDERCFNFAQCIIGTETDTERKLLGKINAASSGWSAYMRAQVFKWWDDHGFSLLPRLLRTRQGEYITDSQRPVFLSGGQSSVPGWAKIDILDHDDETALLTVYYDEIQSRRKDQPDRGDKRILPSLISDYLINLQEQSSSASLISPVNESVNGDHAHAVDFILWLHDVHKNMQGVFGSAVKELKFNLPTASGVGNSDKLYLDGAYGFNLCGELMRNVPGFKPLMYIESIADDIDFLKDIGVNTMPPMYVVSHDKAYVDYIVDKFPVNENAQAYLFQARTVIGLDAILNKASEADIVRWLLLDERLTAPREKNGWFRYQPSDNRRSKVLHLSADRMPGYLRYRFSHAGWINIDGRKVAPAELLIADEAYPIDHIGGAWLKRIEAEAKCDRQELRGLLCKLGARDRVTDLSSDKFYSLLLALPKMDDKELSKRLSRRIYREIIDNGAKPAADKSTAFYDDSDAKNMFMAQGLVLAEDSNGQQSYRPVAEVRFSSTAVYHVPGLHLIKVPPRSGNKQDFLDILGVKEYEQTSRVTNWSVADSDDEFQRDFRQFLPCLMAYRLNRCADAVKLEVKLVDSAEVTINTGGNTEVDNKFEPYRLLMRGKRQWLICVGGDLPYSQLNRLSLAMRLEQVFYVLLDSPSQEFLGRVRTLFICDQASRETMVQFDLGSDDDLRAAKAVFVNDEEIRSGIHAAIGADNPKAESLADNINWLAINDVSEQKKIAELMILTGLDANELSKAAGVTVSIKGYNESLLDRARQIKKDDYKARLHAWLVISPDLRPKFVEFESKFHQPSFAGIDWQDANLDVRAIVDKYMLSVCRSIGMPMDIEPSDLKDIEDIYKRNCDYARRRSKGCDINEMLNDESANSLMYFDDNEAIDNLLASWIKDDGAESDEAQATNVEFIQTFIDNLQIDNDLKGGAPPSPPSGNSDYSPKVGASENYRKTSQGDLAEYLVVRKLVDSPWPEVEPYVGKDYKVNWVSGASRRFTPNSSDPLTYSISTKGEGSGHDIEVVSADGERRLYIEVKSSMGVDCTFRMSANEYEKGKPKQNQPPTRIVFIGNLHTDDPTAKPRLTFIHQSIDRAFLPIPSQYIMVYTPQ